MFTSPPGELDLGEYHRGWGCVVDRAMFTSPPGSTGPGRISPWMGLCCGQSNNHVPAWLYWTWENITVDGVVLWTEQCSRPCLALLDLGEYHRGWGCVVDRAMFTSPPGSTGPGRISPWMGLCCGQSNVHVPAWLYWTWENITVDGVVLWTEQ
ncbi:hypothetical protein ACOMHN_015108 [Nucella lapillus]